MRPTAPSLILLVLVGCSRKERPGAPPIEWQRRLDFPALAIIPAGGGNHFLIGRDPGKEPTGLIVTAIDPRGEEILRRRHELPARWSVADACATADGGCAVVGITDGWAEQATDIFLLRLDSGGEALWRKTFGGPSFEWVKNVIAVPAGGFAIGATTVSRGAGKLDFYLLKVSDSGALEWEATYGAEAWEGEYESAPRVALARDGGFLLVGSTDSPSLVSDKSVEVYVVKTDSAGKKLHEWVIGDSDWPFQRAIQKISRENMGFDVGESIMETADGYILGGTRSNFRPGVVLMKLSDTGKVLWEVTRGDFHGNGNLPMLLLTGGKVLVGTGYFHSHDGNHGVAGYLLQVASHGELEWELRGVDSGIGRVMDLQETPDRGVFVLALEHKGDGGTLSKLKTMELTRN